MKGSSDFAGHISDEEYRTDSFLQEYPIAVREYVPHDGHVIVLKNKKSSTYTEEGYTGDRYCLTCGELLQKGQTIPKKNLSFTDVKKADWYYDSVAYVYEKGLMTGLDETMFGPAQNLARAQFAVILYRMEGEPATAYRDSFPDVPRGAWYTDAVMWASENKIITGYSNTGKFGPADRINREQMAVMMYRYAQYKKYNTGKRAKLYQFSDAYAVSGYAREAMEWAVGTGIITGKYSGTKIDPLGRANRAECATIIRRFVQYYE